MSRASDGSRVRYPRSVPSPKKRPDDSGPAKPRRRPKKAVVLGILGVGLDGEDGHTRITKGDDFVLYGGSADTHGKMQDFTIRLTEKLKQKGKRIRDTDPRMLRDIAEDLGQ